MRNKSLDKMLAEKLVQYWILAIKAYADEKALSIFRSGNDNKLCEEKHKAAKRFIDELTHGFTADELEKNKTANRQVTLARKQMKKVLRELVHPHISVLQQRREKEKLKQDDRLQEIQRSTSALSSTPMTPLYLKRKDTITTPMTENSGIDLSDPRDKKDLLKELSSYVVYEIHEIGCLRKQYKGFYKEQHPPGSYDGLLRVLYENVSFALIKAREFGLSTYISYSDDNRQQALLNVVLFICMLDFDRRIQNNGLIWSRQKKVFSIQSGFMLNTIALVNDVELNLNILMFRLFCDTMTCGDDWVNINTLNTYLKLESILTELQRINKLPEKFIVSIRQIMQSVQDSYITHVAGEFEKRLSQLRPRYDAEFDENRPIMLPKLPTFSYHRTRSVGSEEMMSARTPHTNTKTDPPTPLTLVAVL